MLAWMGGKARLAKEKRARKEITLRVAAAAAVKSSAYAPPESAAAAAAHAWAVATPERSAGRSLDLDVIEMPPEALAQPSLAPSACTPRRPASGDASAASPRSGSPAERASASASGAD
jgi:hypothetical protein